MWLRDSPVGWGVSAIENQQLRRQSDLIEIRPDLWNDSFGIMSKHESLTGLVRIMHITFPFQRHAKFHGRCSSSSTVPGELVDISAELGHAIRVSGRVVKEVPKDRVLLVDNCWGGGFLKIVSDDCQYVMPDNDHQWQVVKPILEQLAQRKVLVMTEFNLPAIKEKCLKSFYSSDGTLINNTFKKESVAPEIMAEAGLVFAGDASNVTMTCYFDPEHQISNRAQGDKPSKPPVSIRCNCMKSMVHKVSVLSTEDGQTVPVQLYNVMRPDSSNTCCKSATLVTHCGAPIKILSFSEVMPIVDAVSRDMADVSIRAYSAGVKRIDQLLLESIKQSIHFTHFSGLLRDYERANQDFATQLQGCENELHSSELAITDNLLKELAYNSVVTEVAETVKKLANLRMVKETAMRLNLLPAVFDSIRVSVEHVTLKELQELADSYAHKYFVDENLNSLVTDGTSGCLIIDNHVNYSKSEKLKSLLAKGSELLQILIGISDEIKRVLKPFMVQSAESCDLQARDKV